MRSVILTSCDILVANLNLTLFTKYWQDEVDAVHLILNNAHNIPEEDIQEFLRTWIGKDKVKLYYIDHGLDPNQAIKIGLGAITEGNIMLLEDDGFIFTQGVVDKWFNLIESGASDMVGSPRYGTGEVADAMKSKYNLDYSGYGDKGYAFWPNFFLCKYSDLVKTDLNFDSFRFNKDQYYPELGYMFKEDTDSDTFGWMSIQLRNLGLTSVEIPQNHAHPFDLQYQYTKEGMFVNGPPDYIHAGSLSSGWGGHLAGKYILPASDLEKQDLETRVAFWQLCLDQYLLNDFTEEYETGIVNLINNCNLDLTKMEDKVLLYKNLMHL